MAGYIKIPRDLFASAEWLTPRIFGKVDAQLDLLQLATYTEERIIRLKSGDVTLRRGQLLTTMRHLAERWGWSAASVHRFLSSLREVREGCIRLLIETTPSEGKTLITIVDYDRWDCVTDETHFETISETVCETSFETNSNTVNRCVSAESEFEKTHRETDDETISETACETRNETQYEVKYSNTGLERKDSNTHTVESYKGGYRGEQPKYSQAEVEEALSLMRWMSDEHSSLYKAYTLSINPRVLCDILAEYARPDVEYIIRSMSFKKAYSATAPFSHTFEVFVRNASSIESRTKQREKAARQVRRYTYSEMCDEVSRLGITSEAFKAIYLNGATKPAYWVRRAAIES